jgi:DNA invertase Pin-like site-specific DNA recombinase
MTHKEITSEIVAEIEELLAAEFTPVEIAAYFEISRYVVEVIARDEGNRSHPAPTPAPKSRPRILEPREPIDVSTIRMIERLLSVGTLSYAEIGRDMGVSKSTVRDVAGGKRTAIVVARPWLNAGETFLARPRRCGACGANLVVSPCRACVVRSEKNFA